MYKNDCIAMVLAGGRGERLGALTRYCAKPAVHFGGSKRIIDFTLNNCMASNIYTIGILTQYLSADLHAYIDTAYNGGKERGRIRMLPPRAENYPYIATANAVYQNIEFIDRFRPEHVLILAGDHIYTMDYSDMIAFHKQTGADATIAARTVPMKEASRYGILNTHPDGRIHDFEEKPSRPKGNMASMGIYVFKWKTLKSLLLADNRDANSHHDFGKDIIPLILSWQKSLYAYRFNGYWRDVGTLNSLWEANMDLLADACDLQMQAQTTQKAQADRSIISEDCALFGCVRRSVLAGSVTVGRGSEVIDSIVMPGAYIGENVRIYKTIIGTNARIMDDVQIGADEGIGAFVDQQFCKEDVSLVAPWAIVPEGMKFQKNSQISGERMRLWEEHLRTPARYSASAGYVSRRLTGTQKRA